MMTEPVTRRDFYLGVFLICMVLNFALDKFWIGALWFVLMGIHIIQTSRQR